MRRNASRSFGAPATLARLLRPLLRQHRNVFPYVMSAGVAAVWSDRRCCGLVSYPAIALDVTEEERKLLDACEEPGIDLLRELIDNLRAHPAQNSAQVIERWSDKPGGDSLEKLLQREQIVADAVAATGELHGALKELAHRVVEGRLKALGGKKSLNPPGTRGTVGISTS